jgi:hypothetical protein
MYLSITEECCRILSAYFVMYCLSPNILAEIHSDDGIYENGGPIQYVAPYYVAVYKRTLWRIHSVLMALCTFL